MLRRLEVCLISDIDQYHDDPVDIQKSRFSLKISGLLSLVFSIFVAGLYLQTTLAANVSLNSDTAAEFGQGIVRTVACSGDTRLVITPISTFINQPGATGFYKFASIRVEEIPTTCRGQEFSFSAYNNVVGSAAQAIFNTTSTIASVHMKDNDTFETGINLTGISVTTNSASSFTVTFTEPVAATEDVFNLTVESALHISTDCNTGFLADCRVGSIGPGGGYVYYVAASEFDCGETLSLKCKFLEVAPSGWNTGNDPTKPWSTTGNQPPYALNVTNIFDDKAAYNNALAIGLGHKNSKLIVDLYDTYSLSRLSYASGLARAYTGGTKNDWYIPTTVELNLLCQWVRGVSPSITTRCTGGTINSPTYGAGSAGFTEGKYWSSSEYGTAYGWYQNFLDGSQTSHYKLDTHAVRPVRAF